MKQITVWSTQQYGVYVAYPVCDTAKFFANLADTKTLTQRAIILIKAQGYQILVKQPVSQL
jgi:hypothetical protein